MRSPVADIPCFEIYAFCEQRLAACRSKLPTTLAASTECVPESLRALATYLERSLDKATSIVMMRHTTDGCTVYMGDPEGSLEDLKQMTRLQSQPQTETMKRMHIVVFRKSGLTGLADERARWMAINHSSRCFSVERFESSNRWAVRGDTVGFRKSPGYKIIP